MNNLFLLARVTALALLLPLATLAQTTPSGGVGIGTTSAPDPSAALEVKSITKGLLPPRLDQTQRDAIGSPAAGLTIYNTTTGKLNTWNGTNWDVAISTTEQPYQNASVSFGYTGGTRTYTVPQGVTSLTIDARGAQGGVGTNGPNVNGPGGLGGRIKATVPVTPGEILTIYVGGQGTNAGLNSGGGGYNGGGQGFRYGGGGGGASDVRRGAAALANRLLTAAGGGGGAGFPSLNSGGSGGYPNGTNGDNSGYGSNAGGQGATQTGPGSLGGSLGQGGDTGSSVSGGGGGGFYGGGAGVDAAGGGGSSWVTPTGSTIVLTESGTVNGDGVVSITPGLAVAAPVLSGANFVNVPGDNLGNHTATTALNLGSNALVGGGSTGLTIASTGAITTAGALTTGGTITAGGNVQLGANLLTGNGGTSGLAVSSTGGVGIGGPAALSAALDVTSSTRGFLPPRLTQTQRDAMGGVVAGLTIYNSTTNKVNVWNGTRWTEGLTTNEQPFQGLASVFSFTGRAQTYTVPAGVYSLGVVAAGGEGGAGSNGPSAVGPGGAGGEVQATLAVTPGEVLTLYVGGAGGTANASSDGAGYNGGGFAYGSGGGGGGATDIRRGTALADRLVVAGGGGGGAGYQAANTGGDGGYPNGLAGAGGTLGGGGATQAAGGTAGGGGGTPGQAGTLGQGGGSSSVLVGAGGGGYYGGGSAAYSGNGGGGGGGSSFVVATGASAITYTGGANTGDGVLVLRPGPQYATPTLSGTNFVNVLAASITGVVAGANLPALTSSASGTSRTLALGTGNSTTFTVGDDLGNHTATQNLNLGTNALVGNGGSTGLTIGSTGNVGIGTSTPHAPLQLGNTLANRKLVLYESVNNDHEFLGFGINGSTLRYQVANAGDSHVFFSGNGAAASRELLRISGSGNVGIGTGGAAPRGQLDVAGPGDTYLTANPANGGTQTLYLPGHIFLAPYGGTSGYAYVQARVPAPSASTNLGLVFRTTNAGNYLDALTLSASGNVGIGNPNPAVKLEVASGDGTQLNLTNASNDPNGVLNITIPATSACNTCGELVVFNKAGGTQLGNIGSNLSGNAVTYNTTSDKRLKENIGRTRFGLADLLKLEVKDYNFIGSPVATRVTGFLAQDLFQVYPDAVKEGDYGPTVTNQWAVDYGRITPLLVQAIQDQQALIEALKAQNAAAHTELQTVKAQAATDKAAATATTEAFEARLRALEASTGQARK